ncbi:MAG TPA: hypothetical protein VK157_17565 [Phycisphaerales bacterium]|nr:hypothetical protein [Phycisphaerales bacterium]
MSVRIIQPMQDPSSIKVDLYQYVYTVREDASTLRYEIHTRKTTALILLLTCLVSPAPFALSTALNIVGLQRGWFSSMHSLVFHASVALSLCLLLLCAALVYMSKLARTSCLALDKSTNAIAVGRDTRLQLSPSSTLTAVGVSRNVDGAFVFAATTMTVEDEATSSRISVHVRTSPLFRFNVSTAKEFFDRLIAWHNQRPAVRP